MNGVMDSLTDFIKGNPFETQVGALILQATDEVQPAEDWSMFMHITDVINNSTDGPKDSVRAFRRRFVTTANTDLNGARHTLSLLDTCIKNCGYRFHIVLCNRECLQDFTKFVTPDNNTNVPLVIQDKVLTLIQSLAVAFKDQVDFRLFGVIYNELLLQNIRFPGGDPSLIHLCSVDESSDNFKKVASSMKSKTTNRSTYNDLSNNQNQPTRRSISEGYNRDRDISDYRGPVVHPNRRSVNEAYQNLDIDRQAAMNKIDLLNNLNNANKGKTLKDLDVETRDLLNELYNNVKSMQKQLMNTISVMQTQNERLHVNEREASSVNTDMDSRIMTLLSLNDDLLRCKKDHEQQWLDPILPKNQAERVPGLKDSITELEEMEEWVKNMPENKNNGVEDMERWLKNTDPIKPTQDASAMPQATANAVAANQPNSWADLNENQPKEQDRKTMDKDNFDPFKS